LTLLGRREIGLWTVGAALAFSVLTVAGQPRLSNDSYQYLSVADNLSAGRGISTDLVHFDVERAHGTVPAPLTTFAPGFPVALAALGAVGFPARAAGALVTLLAAAFTVGLLGLACSALGFEARVARLTLLGFAANANTLIYAEALTSEALFTLLLVAVVLCCLMAEEASPRAAPFFSLAAGILAGCSYWVRYAGVLLVAGLAAALGLLLVVRRTRRAFGALVAALAGALPIVGAGFARNIRLTGGWRGGNNKIVHHPLVSIAHDTITSFVHLVLGDSVSRLGRAAQALSVVGMVLALLAWRRRPRGPGFLLVAVVAGVYALLMFYLGLTSVISYDTRMFFPILPLLLLAFAALVSPPRAPRRAAQALAWASAAAYVLSGSLGFAASKHRSAPDEVAARWALPAADGRPLGDWLVDRLRPGEPLVASDGQVTGYVLHRPVVSLLESEYSDAVWSEPEIAHTMERFHARFLILYTHPTSSGAAAVQRESPFLAGLVADKPATGLTPAARNAGILIFQRRPETP
jgi:hypothetical protein